MIATKFLIVGMGTAIGGWGVRKLIKMSTDEMRGEYVALLCAPGAVFGFYVAVEVAQLLP